MQELLQVAKWGIWETVVSPRTGAKAELLHVEIGVRVKAKEEIIWKAGKDTISLFYPESKLQLHQPRLFYVPPISLSAPHGKMV